MLKLVFGKLFDTIANQSFEARVLKHFLMLLNYVFDGHDIRNIFGVELCQWFQNGLDDFQCFQRCQCFQWFQTYVDDFNDFNDFNAFNDSKMVLMIFNVFNDVNAVNDFK